MGKHEKTNYRGQFAKIEISSNKESECKIGLFFRHEISGEANGSGASEKDIMSVGDEIWNAFLDHRYRFEDAQGIAKKRVTLADKDTISSHRPEQKKEQRDRSFFILSHNHPNDFEVRAEIRDGKKITMLKKGNPASIDNPIILREELQLVSDPREDVHTVLNNLPDAYKKNLNFEFNRQSGLYELLRSDSRRAKTKVRFLHQTDWGPLVFKVEWAFDQGSGETALDQRWPIREFEAEIKGIYRKGCKIDIKAEPGTIGLSHADIAKICADALLREREDFMVFAHSYILQKRRENPARYKDIEIVGVYTSKSTPGQKMLKEYTVGEGKTLADVKGFSRSLQNQLRLVG